VDIIRPSNDQNYGRQNPSCGGPLIRLRNEGREPLQQVEIVYGLKGKRQQRHTWQGELAFMEEVDIQLPEFPLRKLKRSTTFQVAIRSVNTQQDENPSNDHRESWYAKTLVLPENFILSIETNDLDRARENAYSISDREGLVWYFGDELADSTHYRIPIDLERGCYSFRFIDRLEDGISTHWWYRDSAPERVGINGQVQIESVTGDTLRTFPADFGQALVLNFMVE